MHLFGEHNDFDQPAERGAREWGIDALVAVLAFVFAVGQLLLASSSVLLVDAEFRQVSGLVSFVPSAIAFIAVGLTTLPVLLRREAPWPTLVIVTVCYVFFSAYMEGSSLSVVGPMVAVYTMARQSSRTQALIAMALVAAGVALAPSSSASAMFSLVMKAQNALFVVGAGLLGFAVRLYFAYLQQTRKALEEAERSKDELAARRVAEERVRIARDVHDITAHSLSAVAIQAAAAQRLVDIDPAAAKDAIADIRRVSKSSLDEIRSMIGVLRGDEGAAQKPTEGTECMPDVVSYLTRAGIEVSYADRGYDKSQVPAYADMVLYSLAREAATNAVRHANARHVSIVLRSSATSASLSFTDDGQGMDESTRANATGHGLQGMAERASAVGGTFRIKSAVGAGCAIEATIPLEGVHE